MSSRWFLARLGPDAPGMSHSRHSSLSGLSSSLGGGLRQSRALREPRAFPDTSAERLWAGRSRSPRPLHCSRPRPGPVGGATPVGGVAAGEAFPLPRCPAAPRRTVVFQGSGSCAECISELSRVLPKAWALLCPRCFQAPLFILLRRPWSRSPGQDPSLTPLAAPRCEDVMWETHSGCPLGRAQSRPLLRMARSPLHGQKLHKSN